MPLDFVAFSSSPRANSLIRAFISTAARGLADLAPLIATALYNSGIARKRRWTTASSYLRRIGRGNFGNFSRWQTCHLISLGFLQSNRAKLSNNLAKVAIARPLGDSEFNGGGCQPRRTPYGRGSEAAA